MKKAIFCISILIVLAFTMLISGCNSNDTENCSDEEYGTCAEEEECYVEYEGEEYLTGTIFGTTSDGDVIELTADELYSEYYNNPYGTEEKYEKLEGFALVSDVQAITTTFGTTHYVCFTSDGLAIEEDVDEDPDFFAGIEPGTVIRYECDYIEWENITQGIDDEMLEGYILLNGITNSWYSAISPTNQYEDMDDLVNSMK